MMKSLIFIGVFVWAHLSLAGDCVLKIKRDACPGKDALAYKPYNGKQETEEKKTTSDAAACKVEAEKVAKIVRRGTLSKKTVSARFDGVEAGSAIDSAECK